MNPVATVAIGLGAALFVASPLGRVRAAKSPHTSAWVAAQFERSDATVVVRSNPLVGFALTLGLAASIVAGVESPLLGAIGAVASIGAMVWFGPPIPIRRLSIDLQGIRVGRRLVAWPDLQAVYIASFRTGTSRGANRSPSPVMKDRAELRTRDGIVSLPFGARIAMDSSTLVAVIAAAHEHASDTPLSVSTTPRTRSTIGGEVREGSEGLNLASIIAGFAVAGEWIWGLVWSLVGIPDGGLPLIVMVTGMILFALLAVGYGVVGLHQVHRYAESGRRLAQAGIVVGGLTLIVYLYIYTEVLV